MDVVRDKLNYQNADFVCRLFDLAAERNHNAALRNGACIEVDGPGRITVGGDIHDHRTNFIKLIRLAELHRDPGHQLVLQEMVHGEKLYNGRDLSYRMVAEAAQLQLRAPDRVHVLLSNHELAQVTGEDILKHGVSSVEAFHMGLEYVFGEDCDGVHESFEAYVRSLPLAVRCRNGVMFAHSLPSPRKRELFDPLVLTRALTETDFAGPNGSAYLMVWGRNLTQDWAEDLASLWGVDQFVLGHQRADMGYELIGDSMIVMASDHNHGIAMQIDLSESYTRPQLTECIYPLGAMAG